MVAILNLYELLLIFFISGDWCRLQADSRKSKKLAYATGSVKNLKSQWKAYILFCLYFQLDIFNIEDSHVAMYIQFLSRTLSSYSSILNYLSGLKLLFNLMDAKFPPLSSIDIKLVLKGLKRVKTLQTKQAHPLDPHILLDIYGVIEFANQLDVTVWCCLLFGFYGMFRVSQMCPRTLSSNHVLKVFKRKDIILHGKLCIIKIYWSKTNQFGSTVHKVPLVTMPKSPLCPVTAYRYMCAFIPSEPESPAFIGSLHKPLLYHQFLSHFRNLLLKTGPSLFSTHSMRTGGATWAYKVGVPEHLIQTQGVWASDCYKKYIDISFDQRLSVFKQMSMFF